MQELTDREKEVARLAHKSNAEIAAALNISPNTVKVHMQRVFEKLELSLRRSTARSAVVLMAERGEI